MLNENTTLISTLQKVTAGIQIVLPSIMMTSKMSQDSKYGELKCCLSTAIGVLFLAKKNAIIKIIGKNLINSSKVQNVIKCF